MSRPQGAHSVPLCHPGTGKVRFRFFHSVIATRALSAIRFVPSLWQSALLPASPGTSIRASRGMQVQYHKFVPQLPLEGARSGVAKGSQRLRLESCAHRFSSQPQRQVNSFLNGCNARLIFDITNQEHLSSFGHIACRIQPVNHDQSEDNIVYPPGPR